MDGEKISLPNDDFETIQQAIGKHFKCIGNENYLFYFNSNGKNKQFSYNLNSPILAQCGIYHKNVYGPFILAEKKSIPLITLYGILDKEKTILPNDNEKTMYQIVNQAIGKYFKRIESEDYFIYFDHNGKKKQLPYNSNSTIMIQCGIYHTDIYGPFVLVEK